MKLVIAGDRRTVKAVSVLNKTLSNKLVWIAVDRNFLGKYFCRRTTIEEIQRTIIEALKIHVSKNRTR